MTTLHQYPSSKVTPRVRRHLFIHLEFIKYTTDEVLQIFTNGLAHLPESIPESFAEQFSQEIVKNVFNEKRRYELSLNEEDILMLSSKKSDRGLSIDEGPQISDTSNGETDVLKLKKTTVLTGNHSLLKQRNRA